MSATMTASERANWRIRWLTWTARENATEDAKAQVDQQSAALLAYVARLEAIASVARDVVDSANADVVFGSDLSTEERRLSDLLAALDRPEDGEQ